MATKTSPRKRTAVALLPASTDVRTLLQQSRDENLSRVRHGNATPPNYPQAETHAATALALRELAHQADLDHSDPEWQNDTVPHAQMCDFLRAYPSIP